MNEVIILGNKTFWAFAVELNLKDGMPITYLLRLYLQVLIHSMDRLQQR